VNGHFVSWYPPGAALIAVVPLAALLPLGARPDTAEFIALFGKALGAACAASSVAFVYLACRRLTAAPVALLAAIGYAFGTSTWSITSQALWQHAPGQVFAAIGAWLLAGGGGRRARAGMFLGLATVARLTNISLALAGALAVERRDLVRYALWGLPSAVFLATYQWLSLGTPFAAGYPPEPWLARADGFDGLLISPSRGLFVYSPFLLLAVVAWWRAWRGRGDEARLLRATSLGVAGVWLVHGAFGEWWGGWNFGNRYLLDALPFMTLAVAVGLRDVVLARAWPRVAFAVALAWSVVLQFAGAAYYYEYWDGAHWDVTPILLDTNLWRLWDVSDPQWLWVLRHMLAAPDVSVLTSLAGVIVAVILVRAATPRAPRTAPVPA
jgi:hypothetical protein